jgi:hypothetical protein
LGEKSLLAASQAIQVPDGRQAVSLDSQALGVGSLNRDSYYVQDMHCAFFLGLWKVRNWQVY